MVPWLAQNILSLYISMTQMLLVQEVECQEKLFHHVSDLFLFEALCIGHYLWDISTAHQLLYYVKVVAILENLEDLLDMWVINFFFGMDLITL